mmetsp:Transcript_35124/g.113726  ORF Transcript_35124/g.113726 Transcript_35124/m.113726 type:complete len:238 (+) Transcript_35124:123-836(+)
MATYGWQETLCTNKVLKTRTTPQSFQSLAGVTSRSSAKGSTERSVGKSSASMIEGSLGTSSWRSSKTSRKNAASPAVHCARSKALLSPAAAQRPATKAKAHRRTGPLDSSHARVKMSANSAHWRSFGTHCERMRCTAVGTLHPWASSRIVAVNTFLKALGSKLPTVVLLAAWAAGSDWERAVCAGNMACVAIGAAGFVATSRAGLCFGLSDVLAIAVANLAAAFEPASLAALDMPSV